MKISEQNLERYLIDLANSYPEEGDYIRPRIEKGYALGVRQTVSHVLALINGSVSVVYINKEFSA